MIYPAIKLHQLYSLHLCEKIDVIFEDLDMVNIDYISEIIKTKSYDRINIVPHLFTINTINNSISLVGYKINDSTYIVNKSGKGDLMFIDFTGPKEQVVTAIEYLYHMYKNL